MYNNNIKINLSKKEKEMCAYSPIESIIYYVFYPKQLLNDAKYFGQDCSKYFLNTYWKAVICYIKNYQ